MTKAAYAMRAKRRASAQTDVKFILSALTIGASLITAAVILAPAYYAITGA